GGGVSLRISSKIYPRSLFSLTQNVIGRYRNFNCSTESLLAHASAATQLKFIILELIISTARNKTMSFKKGLVAGWGHTGPAVLLPCTPLQSYYLDLRLLSLESSLPDAPTFS
ncbi:hypothetical protein T05_6490, partial [Trichinella murrelli]